jgi:uncharacterized protein (TIRG00374 family)
MSKKTVAVVVGLLFLAVSLGALFFVFTHSIKLSEVLPLLYHFPKPTFFLLFALASLIFLVRSVRLWLLLKEYEVEMSLWQTIKVYIAGQVLAPLPGGEGSRSILIGIESGSKIKDTVTPLLMLGFIELVAALIFTIIGSFHVEELRRSSLLAIVSLVILLTLLINKKVISTLFSHLPRNPLLKKAKENITEAQQEIRDGIFEESSWHFNLSFLYNLAIACVANLLGGVLIVILAHYFGVTLSILDGAFAFCSAIVLTALVPFIPGGVGATEGGMTGILTLMGLALPQAVAVVLVYRLLTLIYGMVLGAIFLLIFYSKALITQKDLVK